MGRVYLIEHCIYEYNRKMERRAYESYITDGLKCISDSISGFFGGKTLSYRFADILNKASSKQEETRTAEEIISSISKKLERLNNESI